MCLRENGADGRAAPGTATAPDQEQGRVKIPSSSSASPTPESGLPAGDQQDRIGGIRRATKGMGHASTF